MDDLFKPTISLFLICLVVTGAMAFTYVGTKETIAKRSAMDAQQARVELLPGVDSFKEVDGLEAVAESKPDLDLVKEAYRGLKNGTTTGYVFTVDSKGYGGDIRMTVGVDASGKVTGLKIGDNKETPGLGSKAKDAPFITQFNGLVSNQPLKVVKGKMKTNPGEIDAISGATITSKAVVKGVQAALDMASELKKKEGR